MTTGRGTTAPHLQALGAVTTGGAEEHLLQTSPVDVQALEQLLFEQVMQCAGSFKGDQEMLLGAVRAMRDDLAPNGTLEQMLVAQMISTHLSSLSQLSQSIRATSPSDQALHVQLASKMQRIFLQQVNVLASLRGAKAQQVNIRHIYMAEGSQAVIGQVQRGGC
jgi:hypothetical protein